MTPSMQLVSAFMTFALFASEGRVAANPLRHGARATSSSCLADKCFSSVALQPSLAKTASLYCSIYIGFVPTVTSVSTVSITSTSTSTTSLSRTTVKTTRTNVVTPPAVTVSSTCATTTVTAQAVFPTSVAYKSRKADGDLRKRADSTALSALLTNCGTGQSLTAKLSSACSCYLGTAKTVTSSVIATVKATVLATVTPTADIATVTTFSTLSPVTATSCLTATTTMSGRTCGVPVVSYTTGGKITCASTASATNPKATLARFRIEGGDGEGTIFDGPCVASGPANITTPSGGTHLCDGTNNGANASPGGTFITQLDAVARLYGFGFDGTFSNQFSDFYISSISSTTASSNMFWGILRDLVFTSAGGCEELNSPGEALWAYDAFNKNFALALSSEYAVVRPGDAVALTISQVDLNGGSSSPAQGATFASAMSGADGRITFTAPTATGCYQFKAARSDSIRSAAFFLTVANDL